MSKSLLMVSRQAPGLAAREALDIVLAGGAFDLPLSLLFLDDGVFQLVKGQQPKRLEQKDLGANLQALPLFGIDDLYVSAQCLQQRGLAPEQLALPVQVLDDAALAALYDQYDLVITL